MSWSERRKVLTLLAAAPLAACGFTPALAPGAPATALLGRIRADDPSDDITGAFVTRLEERLGRPADPGWRLAYTLTAFESRGALEPGLGETRAQITGILAWQLYPIGADTQVARGNLREFTGFSRTSSPLARRSATEDARDRLGRILADALAAELIATAGDWAGPAS
jgi:LPS-assembly lipoprotein